MLGLPLAFLLLWDRTTGAGVFAAVLVGLASAISNLQLWPDPLPILVWPFTLAAFLVTCYATSGTPAPIRARSSVE